MSDKITVLIPPLCPTLCNLVDYSPPDSSIRELELEERSSFRGVAVIKGRGQVGWGLDVGRNGERKLPNLKDVLNAELPRLGIGHKREGRVKMTNKSFLLLFFFFFGVCLYYF